MNPKEKKITKQTKPTPKPQTFTLTLILENEHGFEKEKTIKIKNGVIGLDAIGNFITKGIVAIKNKKPYVSSRSKKSDY